MPYSQEIIEEIRSRSNIVDVIGEYVHLTKKGSSYMGLCPFHNEKSPSFSVSESKQMFHCFGCGEGGDVFSFLMKYQNETFMEAVKELADRSGVKLPDSDDSPKAKELRDKRQVLLDINKEAAKYYFFQLRSEKGKKGYEYFKERELSDETMQKFGLGYSNIGSDDIVKHLRKMGYKDDQIIDAGLASFDEKFGTHDKFWNRVMFPIQDANQKVVGFGGRVMGDGKPKYLNSPETLVFDKSHNLYGLNYAKSARVGHMIICEGYMDVIAMHQAGFSEAVASLGTAFTVGQAQILKRYTDLVILSYDSDNAGTKAALRGIGILKEAGLKGKVLNLEPHKDPDEFIKAEGKEAFALRLKNAESSFFFEVRIMQKDCDMSDPESKTAFYRNIARKLTEFDERLERENYLQAVAARFNIPVQGLQDMVVSLASQGGMIRHAEKPKSGIVSKEAPEAKELKSQRVLLTWLCEEPQIYSIVKKYISPKHFTDELYRQIAEKMFEAFDANEKFIPATTRAFFPEEDQQKKIAEIFNTNLKSIVTKEERSIALRDTIVGIRQASFEQNKSDSSIDPNELVKYIINEKKEIEKISSMTIDPDRN